MFAINPEAQFKCEILKGFMIRRKAIIKLLFLIIIFFAKLQLVLFNSISTAQSHLICIASCAFKITRTNEIMEIVAESYDY